MSYKKKNRGFTFFEMVITMAIVLTLSSVLYYKGSQSIDFNAAEADKLKVVMAINNSNIDGLNENIGRLIAFNTDMTGTVDRKYFKGIYVYKSQVKDPVTGVFTGGGFEQDTDSSYKTSKFLMPQTGEVPKPNVTFNCNESNPKIKACPIVVYQGTTPATELTYPTGKLPLKTVASNKGKLNNNFVVYTFDAKGNMRNRIFFNSQYTILQIYVYIYRGSKPSSLKRVVDESNINSYHQQRTAEYSPDSDPDWEREKYYAIPLKIEIR